MTDQKPTEAGDAATYIANLEAELKLWRDGVCPTCRAIRGGPSPEIAFLQQNLAYQKDETRNAKAERDAAIPEKFKIGDMYLAERERAEAAEKALAEAEDRRTETVAMCEHLRSREAKLVEALRMLLGDLSDAERAVAAWQYGGGMGGNIASEDRGRFPSFASQGHRTLAEALITEPDK